jgi:hypothetical protein
MAGMSTDWLICEYCMGILDSSFEQRKEVLRDRDWQKFNLEQPGNELSDSHWSSGPADFKSTYEVATNAWKRKYGKKPNISDFALIKSFRDQFAKDSEQRKKINSKKRRNCDDSGNSSLAT